MHAYFFFLSFLFCLSGDEASSYFPHHWFVRLNNLRKKQTKFSYEAEAPCKRSQRQKNLVRSEARPEMGAPQQPDVAASAASEDYWSSVLTIMTAAISPRGPLISADNL